MFSSFLSLASTTTPGHLLPLNADDDDVDESVGNPSTVASFIIDGIAGYENRDDDRLLPPLWFVRAFIDRV